MKKGSTTYRTLQYYWRAAWRYPWRTTAVLLLLVASVGAGTLGQTFAASRLFDALSAGVHGSFDESRINTLFAITAALVFVDAFIIWRLIGFIFARRQSLILRDLERETFRGLMNHSYKFFTNRFAGSLVTQAGRFVRSYEMLEDTLYFEILGLVLRVLVVSSILTYLAPILGISIGLFVIFYVTTILVLTRRKMPVTKQAAAADSRVTGELADAITNVINVKIFARNKYEDKRYKGVTHWRYKIRLKSWLLDEWIRTYQAVLLGGFYIAYLWIAVRSGVSGSASFATVLLSQFYIMRIYNDLFGFERVVRRTEQSLSDAAEMTEILDLEPEVKDPAKPKKPRINKGRIEFKDVDFRYESRDKPVFKKFSSVIPAGQKVGLVGHSGSGKTTLTKVLLRFADLQSGEILIDGQNIAQLRQEELRANFAYVPQEPILFHRSLMENIRYGRLDASDDEVRKAARMAHASEFIDKLPDGYETLVGERGIKLSGGEKQRVAIARAMLSPAPILILDEATSALDSKSEKYIAEALDKLMKGRTTIVIAHRLSTIRRLDKILVMEKGAVVEEGSHDELLSSKGKYYELWSHQSGDFLDE